MTDIGSILASAVIFLFAENGVTPIGTAFVVAYPIPAPENAYVPIIVTAKHVIADQTKVVGRFTSTTDGQTISVIYDIAKLRADGDLWEHDDTGVDIVVFRTQHFTGARYQPLPLELLASRADFKTEGIQTTDRVIFPSLLVNFMGATKNYPVIRDGSIALIPDEKVPMQYQIGNRVIKTSQEVLLLDATSIPGASGSPVFLWPGPRLKNGTFAIGGTRPLVLGVMHGFYPASPREVVEIVTKVQRFYQENSGIAIVFPSYRVREIIDGNKVKSRIEKLIASESK